MDNPATTPTATPAAKMIIECEGVSQQVPNTEPARSSDETKISRAQLRAIYEGHTFDSHTAAEIIVAALEYKTAAKGMPRPRMKDAVADALLLDIIKQSRESEVL